MSYLDDPRVFFAAERTLLAWNRTSLALIAFGFVVERSGLLLELLRPEALNDAEVRLQMALGVALLLGGAVCALWSSWQYRRVIRQLHPVEIPEGYTVSAGPLVNLLVALIGLALAGYLLFY